MHHFFLKSLLGFQLDSTTEDQIQYREVLSVDCELKWPGTTSDRSVNSLRAGVVWNLLVSLSEMQFLAFPMAELGCIRRMRLSQCTR